MGVFTRGKKLRIRFQDVDGKWHNPIVPLGRKGVRQNRRFECLPLVAEYGSPSPAKYRRRSLNILVQGLAMSITRLTPGRAGGAHTEDTLSRWHDANTPSADHAEVPPPAAPAPMSWARLLKRVFEIDIEQCPQCGGTLKIIAAIEHPLPPVIAKILTHLGLPARAPPRAAARAFDRFQLA